MMGEEEMITWGETLSVDSEEIDSQHIKLFSIINRFISEKNINPKSNLLVEILSELTDYSSEHFKTEENYMKEGEYPLFAGHYKEHNLYRYKVAMFNVNFNSLNPTHPSEVIGFIKNWWLNHISKSDLQYRDYFRKKKEQEKSQALPHKPAISTHAV